MGVADTATGSIGLPAKVRPAARVSLPWQVVQRGVSGFPPVKVCVCRVLPRSVENPENAGSAALTVPAYWLIWLSLGPPFPRPDKPSTSAAASRWIVRFLYMATPRWMCSGSYYAQGRLNGT